MLYKVVLLHDEEGITARVPGLPGCWSEGDTEAEALANIKDAIRDYLAAVEQEYASADVREVDIAV